MGIDSHYDQTEKEEEKNGRKNGRDGGGGAGFELIFHLGLWPWAKGHRYATWWLTGISPEVCSLVLLTGRLTDGWLDGLVAWLLIGWLISLTVDWSVDWSLDWLFDWFFDFLHVCLTDWLTGSLVVWPIGRLIDWEVGWLIHCIDWFFFLKTENVSLLRFGSNLKGDCCSAASSSLSKDV